MRFHALALALVAAAADPPAAPELDHVAVGRMDRFEARHGVALPASVREWYGLRGVCGRPEFHHQESAWGPEDFGEYHGGDDPAHDAWPDGEGPHVDPVRDRGLLPVLLADRYWAVRLDDGDDPRVVTAWDAFSSTAVWEPGADRFSEFVHTRVWDHRILHPPLGTRLDIAPPGPEGLADLERYWQPRPATESGRRRRFAAADDGERILLRAAVTGPGRGRPVTQCWLWADSRARLAELGARVRTVLAVPPGAPAEPAPGSP